MQLAALLLLHLTNDTSVIFSDNSEILVIKTFTTNQLMYFFKQPEGMLLFSFHGY